MCRFSIFVHWKFAVNKVHNLRPCTWLLFPVYSCKYYSLYTGSFFTYPCTVHFQWPFLCAGILQRICRNSVSLSCKCTAGGYYIIDVFSFVRNGLVGRGSISQSPMLQARVWILLGVLLIWSVLPDFSGRSKSHWNFAVYGR